MRFVGVIGLFLIIGFAWSLSAHRDRISWPTIFWGLGLQLVLALLVLGIPALGVPGVLSFVFSAANDLFNGLLDFTKEGSEFLFGPMLDFDKSGGFIFAVQVLPTIVFFSSLMGVLYHLGLMQKLVNGMSVIMQRTMKTSGAESLSAAANIFVGQTEAPIMVKPYVRKLTQSELMAIMTAGMATVAGGVMAAYVGLLRDRIPDIAGHLMTASVMSAPAALAIAKLILPETSTPETSGTHAKMADSDSLNVIEAAAKGAGDGLHLAMNVGAMLLAFIALIAMVNAGFVALGEWIGFAQWGQSWIPEGFEQELTLQLILGWLFAPVAFFMGIPWSEAALSGALLGEKIVLNEFIAYTHLNQVMGQLSDRTVIILSYALSGFANFSSIAIQIGGIGGIAPERRRDLAALGIRSVIGGSLAAFMTATIAGILT